MSQIQIETSYIEESLEWFAKKTDDLFLVLDREGIVKYVNLALATILQTSSSQMEEKSFLEIIHPEDREKTVDSFLYLQQKESFLPFINRCRRNDGAYTTIFWVTAETADNGLIQVIGQLVDYERMKQRNFNPNFAWHNTFFDISDEAAVILDLNGRVLLMNPAFESLYGWTVQELTGDYLPYIPAHLNYEINDMIERILQGEKVIHQQTIRMKRDGTTIPVHLIISPVYSNSGEIKAISAITKDLTELMEYKTLVEMQSELIEHEEKLLLDITENISEVICLYDVKMKKILYISRSMEKKWGISIDAIFLNPFCIYEKYDIENKVELVNFFQDSRRSPRELELKIKEIETDESRWLRVEITPIIEENGEVNRHISIFRDITELKDKTNQIKQLDQLGAIGQLAAGIAHEVRNPLTAIKGFVQLLAEQANNNYSQIILSEIERIEFIMNEFLVLAKPQKEMRLQKENINHVVNEVISFMNPEALLYNVNFSINCQEVPLVNCEAKQIKQVFINIIKNAIEAMPSGGTISINTTTEPNGFAIIEFKDEGIGISKDRLKRLREPFYSNKEKGTGLGLMISHKLIEDHQGTIHFSSKEGEGTKVKIYLPPA